MTNPPTRPEGRRVINTPATGRLVTTRATPATPNDPTGRRSANVEPLALSIDQAAQALCLSARTIDELARRGELPSFKVGRRRLFSVPALRAWVAAQAAPGSDDEQGGAL